MKNEINLLDLEFRHEIDPNLIIEEQMKKNNRKYKIIKQSIDYDCRLRIT